MIPINGSFEFKSRKKPCFRHKQFQKKVKVCFQIAKNYCMISVYCFEKSVLKVFSIDHNSPSKVIPLKSLKISYAGQGLITLLSQWWPTICCSSQAKYFTSPNFFLYYLWRKKTSIQHKWFFQELVLHAWKQKQ